MNSSRDQVFSTMFAFGDTLENSITKAKKSHEQDVLQLVDMVKKVVIYEPGWQNFEIAQLLRKFLATDNKQILKFEAFKCLVAIIEINILNNPETDVSMFLEIFASSIDLTLFFVEMSEMPQLRNPPIKENNLFLPTTDPNDPEQAIELMQYLLEYMAEGINNRINANTTVFEYWLFICHTYFLADCYPRIHKSLGFLPDTDASGFQEHCPYRVQNLIISMFDSWKSNLAIIMILWDDAHSPYLLEVCQQSVTLSSNWKETIDKSLRLYRYWLMTNRHIKAIGDEHIQTYWQNFMMIISHTFINDVTSNAIEPFVDTLRIVLGIYNEFSITHRHEMEPQTWENLQSTLLECTCSFFEKHSGQPTAQIIDKIGPEIIEQLILIWIRSPITTNEMWIQFFEKFCVLCARFSVVVTEWKKKIIQLTLILRDVIYPVQLEEGESPPDIDKLGMQEWTQDLITEIWETMWNVSGNVNNFNDPSIFQIAMSCITDTVDLLIEGEDAVKIENNPRRTKIFGLFIPWLIEACYSSPDKIRGSEIAYSVLSKLFIRNHITPLSIDLLAHYFAAIRHGLQSTNRDTIIITINSTKFLFSYYIPGCLSLCTEYLNVIKGILSPPYEFPEIEISALTILHSMLCYPYHFHDEEFIDLDGNKVSAASIRDQISEIAISQIHYLSDSIDTTIHGLNGLVLLISQEIHFDGFKEETINSAIGGVLKSAQFIDNVTLSISAVECIRNLVTVADVIKEKMPGINYSIISSLTDNLLRLLISGKFERHLIEKHYETIGEWLTWGSNFDLMEPNLCKKLFQCVEIGILGRLIFASGSNVFFGGDALPEVIEPPTKEALQNVQNLVTNLLKNPAHGDLELKLSSENFISTILHNYNNFPSPAGATLSDSIIIENPDLPTYFFISQDNDIYSFQENEHLDTGKRVNMMTLRSREGKYVWEGELQVVGDSLPETASHIKYAELSEIVEPDENMGSPTVEPDFEKPGNVLDELVGSFAQSSPELLPKSDIITGFNEQLKPSDVYAADIDNILQNITQLEQKEAGSINSYNETRNPTEINPHVPKDSFSLTELPRLFLHNLGYITQESIKVNHVIESGPRLQRLLKDLDNLKNRQVIRVGMMYAKEGQDEQMELLKNDSASKAYLEFIQQIGWLIDLNVHNGSMGGLSPNDGPSSIYHSSDRFELCCHVVPMMPEKDEKLVNKKRHVGNDHVHIVWSEHKRDYDTSVIVSQFNDAHIIIYPLECGLYRIQIRRKERVPNFGPLNDGMVLSPEILANLIRATTINAHLAIRYQMAGFEDPFQGRSRFIQDICNRHKFPEPIEQIYGRLFARKEEADIQFLTAKYQELCKELPINVPSMPVFNKAIDTIIQRTKKRKSRMIGIDTMEYNNSFNNLVIPPQLQSEMKVVKNQPKAPPKRESPKPSPRETGTTETAPVQEPEPEPIFNTQPTANPRKPISEADLTLVTGSETPTRPAVVRPATRQTFTLPAGYEIDGNQPRKSVVRRGSIRGAKIRGRGFRGRGLRVRGRGVRIRGARGNPRRGSTT
eukprot:TRINITY_DN5254_c0_g1_i1.p1 TRINITY_DN5254_c0_g1~~TRINITY_DN5254_c0_g1_i1.p1  ORF type:complete len:1582 (-),score=334.76 TRINITY_DN5254_c0_g1_i1:50-4666(-)